MKKMRFLWIAILASIALSASGQTKEKPWTIGAYAVRSVYVGDLNDTFFDFDEQLNMGGAISIDRYLSRFFDLGIYGSWSKLGYTGENKDVYNYANWADFSQRDKNGRYVTNFKTSSIFNANLHLRWKFLGQDDARWVPFVSVSGGLVGYDNLRTDILLNSRPHTEKYKTEKSNGQWKEKDLPLSVTASAGLGLEFKISPAIGIRYQADMIWTEHDNRDFLVKDATDWQFQHNLGLTWSFGFKKKDADGDGVKDKLDLCPNTPAGVKVDANGCPIDSDGDGVADYLDLCPNTPAGVRVDANGCPLDSDKDGVADYLDKCPNTPAGAKVDANGCPVDSDGDGVADSLDRCPNTPAGVRVDAHGCPIDTDGDGIPDYLDKCPNEKGTKANDGCPEVGPKFDHVLFALNSYSLNNAAIKTLDGVVKEMKANPSYKLEIKGYADSTGPLSFNKTLSNSRANAVKQYLVKKGIDGKRIEAKGFGIDNPVASNATPEGRAKNRRAEVIVLNLK